MIEFFTIIFLLEKAMEQLTEEQRSKVVVRESEIRRRNKAFNVRMWTSIPPDDQFDKMYKAVLRGEKNPSKPSGRIFQLD